MSMRSTDKICLYFSKGKPIATQFSKAYSANPVREWLIVSADMNTSAISDYCSNIFSFTCIFTPWRTLLLLFNSSAIAPKVIRPLCSCPAEVFIKLTKSSTIDVQSSRQLSTATTAAAEANFLRVGTLRLAAS